MPYEARKICNFILTDFDAKQFGLTNLRLNKLLFFVHGWSLRRSNDGLVRNHFEAWQHGPVIRTVFHAFKKHGDQPVDSLAEHLDYESGLVRPISFHDVTENDRKFIRNIVGYYSQYPTNALVGMLHERGGPWQIVVQSRESSHRDDARIPQELIRAYFRELSGDNSRH